jgi:hypothetical protein
MEPMRSVRSVSSLPLVSPHTRVLLVLDRQVDVSCLVRATTRHICAHSSIPSCLSILKPLCLVYIDDLFCPHGSRSKPAGRVGRYIYGALHACWWGVGTRNVRNGSADRRIMRHVQCVRVFLSGAVVQYPAVPDSTREIWLCCWRCQRARRQASRERAKPTGAQRRASTLSRTR